VPRPARLRRTTWWALFLLFLLGILGWTASIPLMASPDEGAHAVRAAGVARGQFTAPHREQIIETWVQRVPVAYSHLGQSLCFLRYPFTAHPPPKGRTPSCIPAFTGSSRLVKVETYEFRGTPHVYWLLGLPSLLIPDRNGMLAMRVMVALTGAALLASAALSALRRPNRSLAIVGVLAGATPMAWYIGGMVNPNGLEIAAAVAAWATVLPLALGDSRETDGRLITRFAIALCLLASIRGLGPAFAAAILVIGAILAPPGRIRALARRTDARVWTGVFAVVTALTVAWVLAVGTDLRQIPHQAIGLGDALHELPMFVDQSIGSFGSNYVALPWFIAWAWSLLSLAGIVVALARPVRRARLALGLLVLGTVALPVLADGFNLPDIGFPWQGRYGLPLTAGLVIAAFGLIDRPTRGVRIFGVTTAVLLLLGQLGARIAVARSLAMGVVRGTDIFDFISKPLWEPGIPPLALLIVALVVLVGIGAMVIPTIRRAPDGAVDA
jgi:hypothetical protein